VRQVRFGVAFFLRDGIGKIVERVRVVEELGYDSVWLAEAQLLTPEMYTLLATCAHNTRRITIGPGVTTFVTRHPTITASGLAALAEIAPGRVGARFGFGGTSTHGVGLPAARLEEYRNGFKLIARLLQGETARINGLDVKLTWANPSLTRQVTLYSQIGSGPRSQRLAGELGHPISLSLPLHEVPEALGRIGDGAEASGRSRSDIGISWWSNLSISHDWEAIKEHQLEMVATRLRTDPVRFARGVSSEHPGADPGLVQRLSQAYDPLQHGDPRAAYAQMLMDCPDDLWRGWLKGRLVGTLDEVAATLGQALEHEEVFEVIVGPRQPTSRLSVEQILKTFARAFLRENPTDKP